MGGEKVGPGAQRLLVRHVRLRQQDAELPRQLVEKQVVGEDQLTFRVNLTNQSLKILV